jgi:hypothetical protein
MGMKQSSRGVLIIMLVLPLVRTHRPARVGGRRKRKARLPTNAGLHAGFLWALALSWMSPQSTTEWTSSMRVSPFLRSSPHAPRRRGGMAARGARAAGRADASHRRVQTSLEDRFRPTASRVRAIPAILWLSAPFPSERQGRPAAGLFFIELTGPSQRLAFRGLCAAGARRIPRRGHDIVDAQRGPQDQARSQ